MKHRLFLLAFVFGSVLFAQNSSAPRHEDAGPSKRAVVEEESGSALGHTCYAKGKKGFLTNTYSGNGFTEFAARVDALQNCYDDEALFCAHDRCD